jgi:5'-nucleotidase
MQNTKYLRMTMTILLTLVLTAGLFSPAAARVQRTVDVRILAINDFHGALEPPSGSGGRIGTIDAGGIEYLGTHLRNLWAPNTVFVAAGDLIGATPLISALFNDEPTIEAMSRLGMSFSAVGNHEFDAGWQELLRLQKGGCHPEDGCFTDKRYRGADFDYLGANVFVDATGKTLVQPYGVVNFTGVKVGFIGVALESTPSIVTVAGVKGLTFTDEVEAINRTVQRLKQIQVNTIVVLIHEGGYQSVSMTEATFNSCNDLQGPIVDIVMNSDPAVDVFITGHTHGAYNCVIDGRIVTGAASAGRVLTEINLTIDKASGDVMTADAVNHIVTRDVPKDPEMTALVEYYRELSAPLSGRVIGTITADITRTANAAGESALGDVIADAQLWESAVDAYGNAQVAFMNPGGIRADLTYSQISAGEQPGEVTYGEAFTVQPFFNYLVSMDLTGAQIKTLLEQQFDNPNPGQSRILQVSEGFSYTWSASAAAGSRVSDIMLNGETVDPAGVYRVTVNSFLADGGDNFTILREGTNRYIGIMDIDALVAYFGANSPVAPGPQDRITRVD